MDLRAAFEYFAKAESRKMRDTGPPVWTPLGAMTGGGESADVGQIASRKSGYEEERDGNYRGAGRKRNATAHLAKVFWRRVLQLIVTRLPWQYAAFRKIRCRGRIKYQTKSIKVARRPSGCRGGFLRYHGNTRLSEK